MDNLVLHLETKSCFYQLCHLIYTHIDLNDLHYVYLTSEIIFHTTVSDISLREFYNLTVLDYILNTVFFSRNNVLFPSLSLFSSAVITFNKVSLASISI